MFVNIGSALLLFSLALRFGSHVRLLIGRLFGVNGGKGRSFSLHVLDITVFYVLASLACAVLLLPVLLQKGIIFEVLGYTFYFWFLVFPLDSLVNIVRGKWTKAGRVTGLTASIGLLAILSLSLFWFPNHIVKRCFTFETARVREPVRIVQLSDLHCECYGVREKALVNTVNALNPDIIVIAGDIFIRPFEFNKRGFRAAVRTLEQLRPRLGIYIVEGHHDVGVAHHLVAALPGKVVLLDGEWAHFNGSGLNLSIVGFSMFGKRFDYQEGKEASNFRIFLAHSPSLVICLRQSDFDLALFGHTHAGQVYIPVITRLMVGRYVHGLYEVAQTPVYVTSGIGLEGYLAPRIRWFTYPEVVVFDLVPLE
jgi:predicted MPP superfamily phosphohydrolase